MVEKGFPSTCQVFKGLELVGGKDEKVTITLSGSDHWGIDRRVLLWLKARNAFYAVKVGIPTVDLGRAASLHVNGIERISEGDVVLCKKVKGGYTEIFGG
jgi:hypothetical protein